MLCFWEILQQLQIQLSHTSQVQMMNLLSLNCIPESLVSNATNGDKKIPSIEEVMADLLNTAHWKPNLQEGVDTWNRSVDTFGQ